ncbi:tripartite tricarboxylate transporter substrate binding protein [Diaphorobacter caeni]|uniref:tripartite tricarboxylate transporter substrate binding protein n=1 Tax=Diaphorobacter caeni TaxID=2784387 RepID=UPI0018901AAA|nr:tripartite tricarboxylate transporter substrate binding protein [Diaphorobacter caeni]MBF5007104.1 tripartite tricarboxylate transporter substrate binding protein [Diaphorobacter caeni]
MAFKLSRLNTGIFCAAFLCGTSSALAAWPDDKPIEVLVGFAAGGGTDVMVRNMLPFVQKHLGGKATFVVVNRPGAASELSNTALMRAKPDGYTVGIVNVPALVFVPMYKKTQYDPAKIALIARVLSDPTVLVARNQGPAASLTDIVKTLKEKPSSVSFGHNGIGTNGHLAMLQLQAIAGVKFNEIPFNGTAQSKTALLGNHIDLAAMTTGELPESGSGSPFRVVAQLSRTRAARLQEVPTAAEQGIDAVMPAERGFAGPQGLDSSIQVRLQAAIEATLKDPAYVSKAGADAPVLAYLPGSDWSRDIASRQAGYKALAKQMPSE